MEIIATLATVAARQKEETGGFKSFRLKGIGRLKMWRRAKPRPETAVKANGLRFPVKMPRN